MNVSPIPLASPWGAADAQVDPPRLIDSRVPELVRRLINAAALPRSTPERRQTQRHPYPQLIRLTPVESPNNLARGESIVVVGKHLSEQGLGFFHHQPLPDRWVIATMEDAERNAVELLVDVFWCRFTRHGWYESGGRFLQAIEPTQKPECAA
jgi:hypothetical protein